MKKKLISLVLILSSVAGWGATEFDMQKGVDLTATNQITQSLLNQLVDNARTATNKGMVIRQATTPDIVLNTRYTNFLWLDTSLGLPGTLRQWNGSAWVTASLGIFSVGDTNIAPNAITSGKLAANAVNETNLAGSAVTSPKIADLTIIGADIAFSTLSQGKFSFGAIVGGDITNQTITFSNIAPGTIRPNELAFNAIMNDQLSNGVVTTAKIALTNIDRTLIRDQAIGVAQITNAPFINTNHLVGVIGTNLLSTNVNHGLAKAWAFFLMDATLVASYNVASILDMAAGEWRVNFAVPMTSTNYVAVVSSFNTDGADRRFSVYSNTTASVSVDVQAETAGAGVMIVIFGGD